MADTVGSPPPPYLKITRPLPAAPLAERTLTRLIADAERQRDRWTERVTALHALLAAEQARPRRAAR